MVETATRSARALYALLELSKALGSELDLDSLLGVIVEKASAVVEAERTSIFVYDETRDVLWTRRAQGLSDGRIELARGSGVAGDVALTMRPANIDDPYADPRFNREADQRGSFRTRSILAAPIAGSGGKLLGVVESMNKTTGPRFDDDDVSLIEAVASHIAIAIERAAMMASRIENERLSEALKLASEIQMRMLPSGTVSPGADAPFDLHAYIRPARMVGGDLYDYAYSGGRLYFCVGDVAGKGIGSALVMALTKTLFRANVPHADDAAKLVEAVNVRLCEETGPTMFVTAFCGFLDLDSGALRFCNAGHDRPLILRSDGTVEVQQSKPGLALGVMPRYAYPLQEMRLASGDALFLYTDGVTEAANAREELFGMERLRAVLAAHGQGGSSEVINAVTDAVDAFVEGAPQSDDMTMLCLRYLR